MKTPKKSDGNKIILFSSHCLSYYVSFFIVGNLLTSPGFYWFYWPIIGWGVGVFIPWCGNI